MNSPAIYATLAYKATHSCRLRNALASFNLFFSWFTMFRYIIKNALPNEPWGEKEKKKKERKNCKKHYLISGSPVYCNLKGIVSKSWAWRRKRERWDKKKSNIIFGVNSFAITYAAGWTKIVVAELGNAFLCHDLSMKQKLMSSPLSEDVQN